MREEFNPSKEENRAMLQMLTPICIKDMEVRNRITLPPMCMYCAGEDSLPNDSHFVHYVSRAVGGTGLIIMEATGVLPRGRISDHCLGLWNDGQGEAIGKIVKACQARGAKMAIQLNHAGRKCAAKTEPYIHAPSPIPFSEDYQTPKEITVEELAEVVSAFQAAAKRACQAGFDALEIHAAHGYLISEFLSPLTNKRTDAYGGSLENRCRLLEEVLAAVRQVWPEQKPLLVRVSAEDYLEDGIHPAEMVEIVKRIKPWVDMVDVSTGGVAVAPIKVYPGYQVKAAQTIRESCGIPTIAVGLIKDPQVVEEILGNGRADMVGLGREQFRNPNWVLNIARDYGIDYPWPQSYEEAGADTKQYYRNCDQCHN